jgi:hypothetical protein
MISAQTNYHLTKDTANSTVEFVNNMLHPDSQSYLSSMNPLSHVSKMCSSLSAHWPTNYHHHHHQTQPTPGTFSHTAAAAAAALAAGHNIDSILGSGYKIDDKMNNILNNNNNNSMNSANNKHGNQLLNNSKHKNEFNNSYDGGIKSF